METTSITKTLSSAIAEIVRKREMFGDIKLYIENDKVMLDNVAIAEAKNLSFMNLNDEFKRIKKEVEDAQNNYEALKQQYLNLKDSSDKQLESEICKSIQIKNTKIEEFTRYQQSLLNTATHIATLPQHLQSERIKKAITLFEQGKPNEADAILNRQQINEAIVTDKSNLTTYIEEDLLKIKMIQSNSSLSPAEKIKEVSASYNQALELIDKVENYSKEKSAKILFDYALYLNLNNQLTQACEYYEKALAIVRVLAKEIPNKYEDFLTTILNDLGLLYDKTQAYPKAKSFYEEALEIYLYLSKTNPTKYEPYIALTLNNVGTICNKLNQIYNAKRSYQGALKLYHQLVKQNPNMYESNLAMTLLNFGKLYSRVRKNLYAEVFYKRAIDIYRHLSQTNPIVYEVYLASALINRGSLNLTLERYFRAEKYYREALEIRYRLSKINPNRYDPSIAGTLNNLGFLYNRIERYAEAETSYQKALDIYTRLSKSNPQYELYVALILTNMAELYGIYLNKLDKGLHMAEESLSLYKKFSTGNPQFYQQYISRSENIINVIKQRLSAK